MKVFLIVMCWLLLSVSAGRLQGNPNSTINSHSGKHLSRNQWKQFEKSTQSFAFVGRIYSELAYDNTAKLWKMTLEASEQDGTIRTAWTSDSLLVASLKRGDFVVALLEEAISDVRLEKNSDGSDAKRVYISARLTVVMKVRASEADLIKHWPIVYWPEYRAPCFKRRPEKSRRSFYVIFSRITPFANLGMMV